MTYPIKFNIERLHQFKSAGSYDVTAEALGKEHPLLLEMGIEPQTMLEALNAEPENLETLGIRPAQLEAIIRVTNRPPLIVRNDRVELIHLPAPFPDDIARRITSVERHLRGIGRVEFVNRGIAWGGTGWIVDHPDDEEHLLILTNRHVAEMVARRGRRGEGIYMRSPTSMARYGAVLDFNEEVGADEAEARQAPILAFTYLADSVSADVAIGRIARPEGFEVAALPLADADGEMDEPVAAVGYPAHDSRNDEDDMARYFKGLYDVKRFSPGFLIESGGGTVLSHDCTTLGGNSGSPVISLDSGKVVGLHFGGRYGEQNAAVRGSSLRSILRGERPSQVLVRGIADGQGEESADGSHAPEDLAGRDGYDETFLAGHPVPLPVLPDGKFTLSVPSDATPARPHEIRYTHFGVLYCEARKSPVVAAVNIDGEKEVKIKRGRDKWFFDLRIPREAQLGRRDFPGDLDRGHMVRREDPNWGSDTETAERANFDTFHYTNASPQHASLNRNRQTWQGLENHILKSVNTLGFRASVLTGPVFDEEDPFFEEVGITLPLEYWKVIAMLADDGNGGERLHATAYLLSQGRFIQKFLADRARSEAVEGFAFGAYKTFQIAIADLEAQTGYDFGPLGAADPLRKAREQESIGGAPVMLEIDDLDQIVL